MSDAENRKYVAEFCGQMRAMLQATDKLAESLAHMPNDARPWDNFAVQARATAAALEQAASRSSDTASAILDARSDD